MTRILAVDDDPVSLKLIASILEKHQLEVIAKASGKEALIFLRKGSPVDLIVSDVEMPVVNGFQLLKFVKSQRRFKRIPFILCTTRNDKKSVLHGHELGVTDYIVKPINPGVLISKVRRALEASQGAVLIVDDEKLICRLLAGVVFREGYDVLTAYSGREALEKMEGRQVTVVLSDIKMPDINGLELLAAIKEKYPSVSVVLMTGYGDEYRKDDLLAAGASGVIAKPFHNTAIVSTLEALTNARADEPPPRTSAASTRVPNGQTSGSHGRLTDMGLVDLLQALGPSRKTVRVTVTPEGSTSDRLVMCLREGHISYAQLNDKVGAEAVYDAIEWTDGTWTVEPISPEDLPEPNNEQSNESILMEGCRLLDEKLRTDQPVQS